MACNVVDLAIVDFLEKNKYVRWHEKPGYPGEYRVPTSKLESTYRAINELTLAARKYGVTHNGPMFFISKRDYDLKPGTSERVDNMIEKGITSYFVLMENKPFIEEFQRKYDNFQESKKNRQLKIDFDGQLKDDVINLFNDFPEFFSIGTQEDYINFIKETNKVVSENNFEEFEEYVESKKYSLGAPQSYTNTRTGETIDTSNKDNLISMNRYIEYKKQLLDNLKKNLDRYYKLNKSEEGTETYKKRVSELHELINKVEDEVGQLTSRDAETVFSDIIEEISELSSILDNPDTFIAENFELTQRLNILSNLILGQNIDGSIIQGDRIMFDGDGIEGYNDKVVAPMVNLQNKYDDFLYKVAKDAFLNDPIFVENKDNFTEEEIEEMLLTIKNKGADINLAQKSFLGANSNIDAIPFKVLINIFQINVRKREQVILDKEDRLSELQEKLRKSKFNIENFYAKDEYGIMTGKLISKYTVKWFRSLNVLSNLKKEFDFAHNKLKPAKYKNLITWYSNNVSFIDIRKLKVFKDMYGEGYKEYFTFSENEMNTYESQLRKFLGKSYDDVINKQIENVEKFIKYRNAESDRNTVWSQKNIDAVNPFLFLENYYSENKKNPILTVVDNQTTSVYNTGRYNHFVPLREVADQFGTVDAGFDDSTFENIIEPNDDAYEAQKILQELLSEHINPAYSINGINISALEIPMLRKHFSEVLVESKGKGILPLMKAVIHYTINEWKDKWFDNSYSTDKKGIVSNYSNVALREVNNYKKVLTLKSSKELLKMAKNLKLNFDKDITKDKLVDAIARAEILPEFSKDIFQNVLAVSPLATMQRARQDTAFIADLLYNVHIKGEDGRVRENSNAKFRGWIDTHIYGKRNETPKENNVITKKKIKRYSDADKRLKKILDEISVSNDDMKFRIGDSTYSSIKDTDTGEVAYLKTSNTNGEFSSVTISASDFEKKLNEYIKEQADNLGITMTFSSMVSGILNNLSIKFLGFNPKSGLKNLIEGSVINIITDAEGIKWPRGSNRYSNRILTLANTFRFSNGKLDFIARKRAAQLKTIDELVKKLGVLQDRKDFRDKKNQVSAYDKYKDFLDVYNFAVGMPEYIIQVAIVLNILQGQTIKNYKGEEAKFVNGSGIVKDKNGRIIDTENFMTAYIPGTLKLKPEYRYTAEAFNEDGTLKDNIDLNKYINTDNIGYETFQVFNVADGKAEGKNTIHLLNVKIQDSINKTQGNFSNMDSILIMKNTWGRFAMIFKRYLPELINQRFGTFGNDIIQGQFRSEGRYRVLFRNPGALGIFSSTVATAFFGPLIGGITLSTAFLPYLTKRLSNKWFHKGITTDLADNGLVAAGMLKEILIDTLNLPLTIVKSKWQLEDIKALSENKSFKKLQDKGVLTKEELGAISACAQELALTIGTIMFIMLAKDALGGGDDEDEDKKQIRNFIDNYGNQILKNLTVFMNPAELVSENTRLIMLAPIEDSMKFFKTVLKYYQYDEGSFSDIMMSAVKAQPLVPVFTNVSKALEKGGVDKIWKDEREYDSGQWFDYYAKSNESISKTKLTNRRKELRETYMKLVSERYKEELGYEDEELVEKVVNKIMNDEDISRQYRDGESYEEALDRIDFEKAEEEAKETVEEIELIPPEE